MDEYSNIDIKEMLYILATKWYIIASFTIIAAIAALILSIYVMTPVYEADVLLFAGRDKNDTSALSLTQIQVSQKHITDYREIARSRLVAQEAIEKLGLQMTQKEFTDSITVNSVRDSRMFRVGFKHKDPETAALVANGVPVILKEKADKITGLGNIKLVDPCDTPKEPVKPNVLLNLAIACCLGMALGAGIVLIYNFMDNTVKSSKDIERYLDVTLMGEIPSFDGETRQSLDSKGRIRQRINHSMG